jgi:hypothetical protein
MFQRSECALDVHVARCLLQSSANDAERLQVLVSPELLVEAHAVGQPGLYRRTGTQQNKAFRYVTAERLAEYFAETPPVISIRHRRTICHGEEVTPLWQVLKMRVKGAYDLPAGRSGTDNR